MMTLELDDETTRLRNQLMEREHTGAAQLVKKALSGLFRQQASRTGINDRHYRHPA
jgi:hypothetical protein